MVYATFASFLQQIQLVPGHLLHQLQPVFGHPRFQECHERISSWLVSQDPGDRDERLNSDLFLKSHGPLVCADGDLPLLGRPRVFVRQPWEEEECRSAGRWRHLRDRASWCTRGDEAVPTCTPNRVDVTFQQASKILQSIQNNWISDTARLQLLCRELQPRSPTPHQQDGIWLNTDQVRI